MRPAAGATCRSVIRAAMAGFVLSWAGGLLGGCAAPTAPAIPASAPAQFVVVNLSDRSWEIVLTGAEGIVRRWPVAPWATFSDTLPPGSYRGEQVLQASQGGGATRRQLEIVLAPGKSYRWRLTAVPADAAAEAAGTREAEASGR